MKQKKKKSDCIRLDPEERLCPEFDATSIKLYPEPETEKMGFRILDNCPEEHIQ